MDILDPLKFCSYGPFTGHLGPFQTIAFTIQTISWPFLNICVWFQKISWPQLPEHFLLSIAAYDVYCRKELLSANDHSCILHLVKRHLMKNKRWCCGFGAFWRIGPGHRLELWWLPTNPPPSHHFTLLLLPSSLPPFILLLPPSSLSQFPPSFLFPVPLFFLPLRRIRPPYPPSQTPSHNFSLPSH